MVSHVLSQGKNQREIFITSGRDYDVESPAGIWGSFSLPGTYKLLSNANVNNNDTFEAILLKSHVSPADSVFYSFSILAI